MRVFAMRRNLQLFGLELHAINVSLVVYRSDYALRELLAGLIELRYKVTWANGLMLSRCSKLDA